MIALFPCGHLCYCLICAKDALRCPVCNTPIAEKRPVLVD
jgi:hypothetical protein